MYRDDHEAALARVEALEKELTHERADDAAQAARVEKLETQLAAAKAKLAQTQEELDRVRPPKPEPKPPDREGTPASQESPFKTLVLGGGLLILVIVFAVVIVRAAGKGSSSREDPPRPEPPRAAFIPDSISGTLPELNARGQELLPGSRLIELRGKGITSEGTLHAQYGELRAVFFKEVTPQEPEVDPNVPIGAAPHVEPTFLDKQRCAYVTRTAEGWQDDELNSMHMCMTATTMTASTPSAIEPNCSMKSIWARAIADGAPAGAIAELSLDDGGWTFVIDDQRFQFRRRYSDDCTR